MTSPRRWLRKAFGKAGTFTANGATNVVVADTNVKADSQIIITVKTPAGTVGATPSVKAKVAGTSFTVAGTALDTSVYNYNIVN